jgi:hypothetical protein
MTYYVFCVALTIPAFSLAKLRQLLQTGKMKTRSKGFSGAFWVCMQLVSGKREVDLK